MSKEDVSLFSCYGAMANGKSYMEYLKAKDKELERLHNIINELNNAYCKVITKCEEMINSRFYMNDNAIKKYADEIKDICKYYVGEANELKGVDRQ